MAVFFVRVTDQGKEQTFTDTFRDLAHAKDILARRGWNNPIELREISSEELSSLRPETANPETTAPLMDVEELKQAGAWVYLPEAAAQRHPLYGSGGWMALVGFGLVVGPFIAIGMDALIISNSRYQRDLNFGYLCLAIDIVYAVMCYITYVSYSARKPSFQIHFYILTALLIFGGLAVEISASQIYRSRISGASLSPIIAAILWATYVARSKRVNVTTRSRVYLTDPFLKRSEFEKAMGILRSATKSSNFQKPEKLQQPAELTAASVQSAVHSSGDSSLDRLRRLKAAFEEGLITKDEYDKRRSALVEMI